MVVSILMDCMTFVLLAHQLKLYRVNFNGRVVVDFDGEW